MLDYSSWQLRRSNFNHHWLKNRLLQALDSAANLLHGRIRGSSYLEEILTSEVREWESQRLELEALLQDFETEMSPQRLFEFPPLCDWDPQLKSAIGMLMHRLWLLQCPVDDLVDAARACATDMSREYTLLIAQRPVPAGGSISSEFVSCFEAFRLATRRLASAIEKFPKQVQIL
jgi:hypothetical protein